MRIQRSVLALAALAGIAASAVGIYSASAFGAPHASDPVPPATATTTVTGTSHGGVAAGTPAKGPVATPAPVAHWQTAPALKDGYWVDVASRNGQTWAVGSVTNPDGTNLPIVGHWDAKKGAWVRSEVPNVGGAVLTSIAIGADGRVWVGGAALVRRSEDTTEQIMVPILNSYANNTWQDEMVPFSQEFDGTLSDVQVAPDGKVWVLGESDGHPTLMRRIADGNWQDYSSGLSARVAGPLVVVGAREAFVPLSKGMIAHINGDKTTVAQVFGEDGLEFLSAGAAKGKNDVWFVGHTTSADSERTTPLAVHFDGTSWRQVKTPQVNGSFEGIAINDGVPTMVGNTMKPGYTETQKPLVAEYYSGRVRVTNAPAGNGSLTDAASDGKRLWVVGVSVSGAGTSAYRQ